MLRKLLAPLFVLAVCGSAEAASVTPPNLTAQTSVANSDLMLVWPAASVGPLQAITWANVKAQIVTDLGGSSWLKPSNNLSDVSNATTARTNLGLGSIAVVNAGTSGNTVCILNNACTWAASQLFQSNVDIDSTGTVRFVLAGTRRWLWNLSTADLAATAYDSSGTQVGAALTLRNSDLAATFGGHILSSGTAPAVSLCGTSPSITGASNDNRGFVSDGSGTVTSCTVTFARAWAAAPICTASPYNVAPSWAIGVAATTTTLTVTFGASFNGSWQYICEG